MDVEGLLWAATDGWVGTLGDGRFEQHSWDVVGEVVLTAGRLTGVWLADSMGLARLSRVSGQWFCKTPNSGRVRAVLEDLDGSIWLGLHNGGLLRVTEGQFDSIGVDEGGEADPVLALGRDEEGNLWVGTQNGGLSRLRQRVIGLLDKRNGLTQDNVLSVCEDSSGGVWLGTDAGLHRVQPGGELTRFSVEHGLKNEHITAVWEDRRRVLWVGTWGGGLFRRNGERFEPVAGERKQERRFIRSIYEDDLGRIWVGTQLKGVFCFEASGVKAYGSGMGLAHSDVRAIYRDRSGGVWFGTGGGGLGCLRDGKISMLTSAHGLPSDHVRVLFEDEKGALWVGTGGGLARVQAGKVVSIRTEQGLPDNFISQIFKDRRGTFWFGSNRGIFRVSAQELERVADGESSVMRCFIYNKAEGLGGRECNGGFQPAGCQTRDGRLWFPTPKGVAIVDPGNLRRNARLPRVMIEEVLADGKPLALGIGRDEADGADVDEVTHEVLPRAGQVHVPANCQRLEIRYTGINFSAPRRIQFQYRLGNGKGDWVEAGVERVAVYLQPASGRRLFQVRAVSSDGVWSEISRGLRVTVETPFWRTWWFLGITGAALVGLLAHGVRLVSLRKIRRAVELLEQQQALAAERSRIASDMHDQLGSRLTQLSLLGELALREAASPESVARHLDKITAQSREVAKSLDEIVWTVNPGNDTLERTAAYIVHFTEEFFEPTLVRCRLDVPANLPECTLSADHRHQLFLAFKEALTNVARHAAATEVEVRLSAGPQWMELSIRDDGRGFIPTKAIGNGLGNMRARIEGMGGRFDLSSQPGAGTRLTFRIPLAPVAMSGKDVSPSAVGSEPACTNIQNS
ncbi:MAG: two-component regulator propeller domain-containing protein [Limisphaerales bacterium]